MNKFILLICVLIVSLSGNSQTAPTADSLLTVAVNAAHSNGKKIMIKYTASWCGWCHKMDTAMADPSIAKYFDDNYIVVRLHVDEDKKHKNLENEGAAALKIDQGGANQGLPYWVIIDTDKTVLANSKAKKATVPLRGDGDNVGCPAKKEEVAYFLRVLKETGTFSKAAIEKIRKRFEAIGNQ